MDQNWLGLYNERVNRKVSKNATVLQQFILFVQQLIVKVYAKIQKQSSWTRISMLPRRLYNKLIYDKLYSRCTARD